MAKTKFFFLLIIAILFASGCDCSDPVRTIRFKGNWTQDQKEMVFNATNQWCEAVGDCVVEDKDSPNTIEMIDDLIIDGEHVAGNSTINLDYTSGTSTETIKICTPGTFHKNNSLEKELNLAQSTIIHEFGHMLSHRADHSTNKKAIMYDSETVQVTLTDTDVDYYYGLLDKEVLVEETSNSL